MNDYSKHSICRFYNKVLREENLFTVKILLYGRLLTQILQFFFFFNWSIWRTRFLEIYRETSIVLIQFLYSIIWTSFDSVFRKTLFETKKKTDLDIEHCILNIAFYKLFYTYFYCLYLCGIEYFVLKTELYFTFLIWFCMVHLVSFGLVFVVTVLKVLCFWCPFHKVIENSGFISYSKCNLL